MNSEYTDIKVYRFLLISILMLSLSLFTACEEEKDTPQTCNTIDEAGELIEANFQLSLSPAQIQPYLALFGAPLGFTLTYTADAYQIIYKTRDKNGDLIEASGAMFLPQNVDTLDLVSVQHGTTLKRENTGSVNPLYAMDAILFAMKGFMAVSPDYIGLGVSEEIHPYLHAELTANAVVDMLRAARIYACENDLDMSDELFLAGYSEGGYATMATHKLIESNYSDEFQLTAVAPMSGPYDLIGSTRNLLSRETYDIPAFLAYVVVAYNDIYGWDRLSDIFNEPYAAMLPGLYDGSQEISDVNGQLPTAINALFKTDFTTSFFANQEGAIEQALEDNTLLDWGPIAPVRLFHGTADSTVSIDNTYSVYHSLRENGGTSVDLVTLLGANHTSGFVPSMILAEAWFDSIRTANQ
ncbi:MAG: lipase family protein [Candidatus Marinimicrobia bacterium]|nr:lipase family protein [Candidatus Neomarinimicrobiota bacterium]